MIIAVCFNLFPTLLVYLLMNHRKFVKSTLLRLSLFWFLGQYISTIIIYVLSCFLATFTANVLFKSIWIFLVFVLMSIILLLRRKLSNKESKKVRILRYKFSFNIVIVLLFCIIFSIFLYKPHLYEKGKVIHTSPVYWDIKVHYPIVQNFINGDNFPPENDSFSGIPMTYHFFFDLVTAIYASSGFGFARGTNLVSILTFSFMLVSIVGFGQEVFRSLSTGFIAVLFTITSSSLRFIDYFLKNKNENLFQIFKNIFTNTQHPYFFSFIDGNRFGYNGSMFNIFYYIEERQLTISIIFLIFSMSVFLYREHYQDLICLILGMMMGLFFQWHLFVTIMVGCIALFILIFSTNKRKIFILTLGFGTVFLLYTLFFKSIMNSGWFNTDIFDYPKINFDFSTFKNDYQFSIFHAIFYYLYAYGIKVIFVLIGLFYLLKKNKQDYLLILAAILPIFILLNSVQLSPISVYDNHKWLIPMNIVVNLVAAFGLEKMFFRNNLIRLRIAGTIFLLLLILSGFIELMPYLNSKPVVVYANENSPAIEKIRQNSLPQSTYLGNEQEIYIAGRKMFLRIVPGQNLGLNYALRVEIANQIYNAPDMRTFCDLTKKYKINYVSFIKLISHNPFFDRIKNENSFEIINIKGERITYVNMNRSCMDY